MLQHIRAPLQSRAPLQIRAPLRYAAKFVLFFLVGCGPAVRATPTPQTPPPAAEVKLQLLSFDEVEQLIAAHKGKVVVVDVWSSSCAPCIKEFPHLVELSQEYREKGVACVSLNIDYYGGKKKPEEYRDDVLKRLVEWKATFDNVLSKDEDTTVLKRLDLTAPPAVYVYDRTGQLAHKFTNDTAKNEEEFFTYKQVRELVEKLVGEKK